MRVAGARLGERGDRRLRFPGDVSHVREVDVVQFVDFLGRHVLGVHRRGRRVFEVERRDCDFARRVELRDELEVAFRGRGGYDVARQLVFFFDRFGDFFFFFGASHECFGADVEVAFGVEREAGHAFYFFRPRFDARDAQVFDFVVVLEDQLFFTLVDEELAARVDRGAADAFEFFGFAAFRFRFEFFELREQRARFAELVDRELFGYFFFRFFVRRPDDVHVAFGRVRYERRVVDGDRLGELHFEAFHERLADHFAGSVQFRFEDLDAFVAAVGDVQQAARFVDRDAGGVRELAVADSAFAEREAEDVTALGERERRGAREQPGEQEERQARREREAAAPGGRVVLAVAGEGRSV